VPANPTLRQPAADAVLCLINLERTRRGLTPLLTSSLLTKAATTHACDMVRRKYFAHVSPGGEDLRKRVVRTGYVRGSRNLALGEAITWGSDFFATPSQLVKDLMQSPPHKAIIDDPGPEGEMEQIGNREQRDHRRKPGFSEREHRQRQSHVAAIVEHHRRDERAPIDAEQLGNGERQQSRADHHADAAEDQQPVVQHIEIPAGKCGKDQRRGEHIHAEAVDHRHLGLHAARIEITQRDDGEDRQDDAEDAPEHGRYYRRLPIAMTKPPRHSRGKPTIVED